MLIRLGRYIHFKGNEYEVIGTATQSETLEEMVIYRALNDDEKLWVRPASMWNEIVEYNGQCIKRFTHIDEIAEETTMTGIHNYSTPAEKVELFMSLFMGRDDVFAKRWENAKKGTAGYVPVCHSEWSLLCPRLGGVKVKCGECPSQNFAKYDADVVHKHLKGQMTLGVYPMLHDETCRFLAFDFDGKEYSQKDLQRDVSAIREACFEKNINMAVERSRSGRGIHFWIFFAEYIPATIARKLGSSLITYAMRKHYELPFKTYDRMIPAQDTLPNGGFGNLIALPLQKVPREQGNSVFLDENFNEYSDQWNYLYNVKKYTLDEIEGFIRELSPSGELGDLRRDTEDEKPWENKRPESKLSKSDFPDTVRIVRANLLYIEKAGISSSALNKLKRLAAFGNPEFYKAQAMRLSTFDKPRVISCSDETEQYLCLPKGLEDEVSTILDDNGVNIQWDDETNEGRSIDVMFNGELRGEQQQACLYHGKVLFNNMLGACTACSKANRKFRFMIMLMFMWRCLKICIKNA